MAEFVGPLPTFPEKPSTYAGLPSAVGQDNAMKLLGRPAQHENSQVTRSISLPLTIQASYA